MKRSISALAGLLSMVGAGVVQADAAFESVSVRIEQNLSDKDGEVVFEVTSGEAGLAALKVSAPDGRTVIDFKAPDTKLGLRHLSLESPEPKAIEQLKADFPAGVYSFAASTTSGAQLSGKATLSHKMPSAASFVRPRPDEQNVPAKGFELRWGAGDKLATHVVSIEDERSGVTLLKVTLPRAVTAFVVPDGFLTHGTKYKAAVGAVAEDGNGSFVETSFTTAGK